MFGLSAPLRRAAVSIASNIVEGSARSSQSEYIHFLNIAHASVHEVGYQVRLAARLGFLNDTAMAAFRLASCCWEMRLAPSTFGSCLREFGSRKWIRRPREWKPERECVAS